MGEVLIQLDHSNGEVSSGVLQNASNFSFSYYFITIFIPCFLVLAVKGWFDLKARQGKGDVVSGQLELKIRYS
jgi:hypothetical protein